MSTSTNYGNTSASNLLRQATATYNKQQDYNDAVASYTYYISDANQGDFQTYQNYLKGRISNTQSTDPSKALSLQRTADEAYRRFNSAEISRATLSVNYGDSTNTDKYGKIMGLYQAALANGDDALASRLESNLASLSITIQNEQKAASGGSGGGSGGKAPSTSQFDDALHVYDQQMAKGQLAPADYFKKAAQVYQLKEQTLQAAADAGSQSAANSLETLRADNNFQKITSPDTQLKLQRGEIPLAITRDANGNMQYTEAKYKDTHAVLNSNGQPMRYSDIKDQNGNQLYPGDSRVVTTGTIQNGDIGNNTFQKIRENGNTPGSPQEPFQFKYNQKQNPTDLNTYLDYKSGRTQVVSSDGTTAYSLGPDGKPLPGTDPYGLAGANGDPTKTKPQPGDMAPAPSVGEFYGPLLKDALANPGKTLGGALNSVAGAATKFLGGVTSGNPLNALTSIFGANQKKQIDDAKAAAQAAAQQAAIKAAQEQNAQLFQRIQAQNAANALAAQTHPSVMYNQPARTVTQNYAIGSSGGSSPSQVASGIGQVVGYNNILKGVGLF